MSVLARTGQHIRETNRLQLTALGQADVTAIGMVAPDVDQLSAALKSLWDFSADSRSSSRTALSQRSRKTKDRSISSCELLASPARAGQYSVCARPACRAFSA